jgi:hypothetical protein
MALKSFRITKKELETYYDPKTSNYTLMVDSINSNGYGQIIEQYVGNEVLNTYYNIWDTRTNSMVVYEKLSGTILPEAEAGPSFFGVSANDGMAFLNGTLDISGLRKLKYCDACSDGNGLKKPVIENFKQRFTQVKELVFGNNLLEGFLFYDLSLTRYQNVFPAAKIDDGVNVTFQFKNINGTDLTPQDVSTITGKPVAEIELSVDTAPIIKPQEGANTVITSCCEKAYYVISGQYTIGSILYTDSLPESYCWYVESLTKDLPSVEGITFTNGGRSCQACVKLNPCPSSQINYLIEWCCNGEQQIASNPGKTLPVGSYVYFDVEGYSSPCWYVKGESEGKETIFGTFNGASYGECKDCQYDSGRFCK